MKVTNIQNNLCLRYTGGNNLRNFCEDQINTDDTAFC